MLKSFIYKKKTIQDAGFAKLILATCITERRLTTFDELLDVPLLGPSLVSDEEWDILSCHKMIEAKLFKEKHFELKQRLEKLFAYYKQQYKEILSEDILMQTKISQLLTRLEKRYPQSDINGARNIWIAKPAGLSRGRGIHMSSDLAKTLDFIKGKHYVIQKYIEIPLIIMKRKVIKILIKLIV